MRWDLEDLILKCNWWCDYLIQTKTLDKLLSDFLGNLEQTDSELKMILDMLGIQHLFKI